MRRVAEQAFILQTEILLLISGKAAVSIDLTCLLHSRSRRMADIFL
jgi:hypothetical protein